MAAVAPGQPARRQTRRQRQRLGLALLLSTLIHALLLSLNLFGDEFGLPGLAFPWQVRRIEVPNLQAVLAPAPVINAEPASPPEPQPPVLPETSNEQPAAAGELSVIFRSPPANPEPSAKSAPEAAPTPSSRATPQKDKSTAKASQKAVEASRSTPADAASEEPAPPKPFPAVIAMEQSRDADVVDWIGGGSSGARSSPQMSPPPQRRKPKKPRRLNRCAKRPNGRRLPN